MNVEKIQKLIKLLSSPNDGEVVAAARAILRTLESEGTDIHELAKRVEGLSETDMKRLYDAGYQEGKKNAVAAAPANIEIRRPSFYEMACEIQHNKSFPFLTEKERQFVSDMERWCARREPSEKQAKWLHAIYCRVGQRQ